MKQSDLDARFMRRALALASRGTRAVFPNPKVGCVLVNNGRIIGEGWHKICGGPHAEVLALRQAGLKAAGSTAYVTLEPCMPHAKKKTPPCAPTLVAAGVSRVVVATTDPNPKVAGKGLKFLQQKNIKVSVGPEAKGAQELNKIFFTRMKLKRPYVILKSALSLDGQAFAPGGKSQWITGKAARDFTHRLRSQCDAVLVGFQTALQDDPELTSHGTGPNPTRVVLDRQLHLPKRARLLNGEAPTLVFTASPKKLSGAVVIRVPTRRGHLDLRRVLVELSSRGIGTMLIEGGPTIHAAFLAQGLVDEAYVFIAPKLISGSRDPNRAPRIESVSLKRMGDDFLFQGKVKCLPE